MAATSALIGCIMIMIFLTKILCITFDQIKNIMIYTAEHTIYVWVLATPFANLWMYINDIVYSVIPKS